MMRRAVLFSVLVLISFGAAKSYHYPSMRTEVTLQPDGDVRVVQARTYSFDGSFSWAFVDLKKRGAEDIVLNQVGELVAGRLRSVELREVRDGPQSLYVEWGYSAQDEERTFVLDYTVRGAVRRYRDVAEFYWKVVEDEHEPIAQNEVDIRLPGASPDRFKVYVHSRARPGSLEFGPDMDRVVVEQAGIPKNAYVEVRVLAAPGLFAGVEPVETDAYLRILREERTNYYTSLVRTYVLIPLGIILMLVLPIVLLVFFYFRHGREPRLAYDAVYEHEPPRAAPPVVVPAIIRQSTEGSARPGLVFQGMFATLLGLAGRGYVTVAEEERGRSTDYRFTLEKPDDTGSLDPLERGVLEFLFGQVADGARSFTDEEFRKWGKRHAAPTRALLGRFFKRSREWWERTLGGPLLEAASSAARRRFLLVAFLLVGGGTVLVGSGLQGLLGGRGPLPWLVAVGLGMLVYVVLSSASRSILRWREAACLESRRWNRFRKFLVEFSAIEEAPIELLPIWEHYYVYAVALGVARQFLKNVGRLALERGHDLRPPVWYAAAGAATGGVPSVHDALAGLTSLGTNFAGMVSSFSPSSSSGGGFAGGGGGGGGGGSSGAG